MKKPELSVIIPVLNIENKINDILLTLKEETKDVPVEILIVDRGSKDKTVRMALCFLKQHQLNGFVMQESGGNMSQTLNAGIQYANGSYLTFVFVQCMYQSYLKAFLKKARETNAEVLFACIHQEQCKISDLCSVSCTAKQSTGADYIQYMITHGIVPDVGAVMVSKQFLQRHNIWFPQNCTYRCGEDFVYRCFLAADCLAQASVVMQKDEERSVLQNHSSTFQDIFSLFEEVERLLHMLVFLQKQYSRHEKLIPLFMQQKIPETIMQIIEEILKQNIKSGVIRSYLHKKGYDRLLIIGPNTPQALKIKIIAWRYFSKFYRFML